MRPRILLVTVENPWPAIHGGRLRTGKIAAQLARFADVTVAYADDGAARPAGERALPGGVSEHPLPWDPPGKVRNRVSMSPHLGEHFVKPVLGQLSDLSLTLEPQAIWWSHSYLAEVGMAGMPSRIPQVVEFANIETERFLTFTRQGPLVSRSLAALEYLKACRWEPRVARSADLAIAIAPADEARLRAWSASTATARNGMDNQPFSPSPAMGPLLGVANWRYEPNARALTAFLADDWPRIKAAVPTAAFDVVGSGGDQLVSDDLARLDVRALGFVDDLRPHYARATAAIAPATSGAGSQLKVTEALSHSRIVIGPERLAGEKHSDMPRGAVRATGDVVGATVEVLKNAPARNAIEREIHDYAARHSWDAEFEEAREAVLRLIQVGRRS